MLKLRIIGILSLLEVIILITVLILSHDRIENMVSWFIGVHFIFVSLISSLVLFVKYKSQLMNGSSFNITGKIILAITLVLIIGFTVWWKESIFPGIVQWSIGKYGHRTTGYITSYTLILYPYTNAELAVSSVLRADAMVVHLSYDTYSSAFVVQKSTQGFNQLYQEVQKNTQLTVRYFSWFPFIVRPQEMLN